MGRLNPEKKPETPGRKKGKNWKRGEDKRDRSIISEAAPDQPADKVIPIKKKEISIAPLIKKQEISVADSEEKKDEYEELVPFNFPPEVQVALEEKLGDKNLAIRLLNRFEKELDEDAGKRFENGEQININEEIAKKLAGDPEWKDLKEIYEKHMSDQNSPGEKLSAPAVGNPADKVEAKPATTEAAQKPERKDNQAESTWRDLLGKYFFNKDGSWISPRSGKFKIADRMVILLSNKKEYSGDRTVSDLKKIISEGGFTLSKEQYEELAGAQKPAPAAETKPEPEQAETPPAAKENQSEFFSADELAIFEATAKDIAMQMEKEMTSAGKWEEYQKAGSLQNDVSEFFQNIFTDDYNLNPQDAKNNADKILAKIFNK